MNSVKVKLADFGLSRVVDEMIQQMTILGTIAFMAPELLGAIQERKAKAEYDNRIDIWSCGIVGYMLYKGKLPG